MSLAIFAYHAVLPLAPRERVRGAVPLSLFTEHLEWLARKRYRVLALGELVAMLASGEPLPRRACVITFDDGYRSVVEHALPVLERFDFPATLYVITGLVGTTSHLFREQGGEPLEHASWEELGKARSAGFELGAHSRTHPELTAIDSDRAAEEIEGSRRDLIEHFGECASFAYPHGSHDGRIVELVRRAGFRDAVTTNPGAPRPGEPLHALRRDTLGSKMTLRRFRLRLGHWF